MKWDTPEQLVAYLRDNPTSDAMRAAADEIESLRSTLGMTRAYVETRLQQELRDYEGFEFASRISDHEQALRQIDRVLAGGKP